MAQVSLSELYKPLIEAKNDANYDAAAAALIAQCGKLIKSSSSKNVSGTDDLYDFCNNIKGLSTYFTSDLKLSDIQLQLGVIVAGGSQAQVMLQKELNYPTALVANQNKVLTILKNQDDTIYADNKTSAATIAKDGFKGLSATKFTIANGKNTKKVNDTCVLTDKLAGNDSCGDASTLQKFILENVDLFGLNNTAIAPVKNADDVQKLISGIGGIKTSITDYFAKALEQGNDYFQGVYEFLGVTKDQLTAAAADSTNHKFTDGSFKGKSVAEALTDTAAKSLAEHKIIATIAKNFNIGAGKLFEVTSEVVTEFKISPRPEKNVREKYKLLHKKVCGDDTNIFKSKPKTTSEKCHADLNQIAFLVLSEDECISSNFAKDEAKCYEQLAKNIALKSYYDITTQAQDDGIDINAAYDLS